MPGEESVDPDSQVKEVGRATLVNRTNPHPPVRNPLMQDRETASPPTTVRDPTMAQMGGGGSHPEAQHHDSGLEERR